MTDLNPNDSLWHGTTILCVRRGGRVAMAGDGQVSLGNTAGCTTGLATQYALLKHLVGLLQPDSGHVWIGDVDMAVANTLLYRTLTSYAYEKGDGGSALVADLATDTHLLEWARAWAPKMLDQHPGLSKKHTDRWLGGKSEFLKA